MTPLIVVFVAAVVTVVSSLVWAFASNVWARVSMRRWDRGSS